MCVHMYSVNRFTTSGCVSVCVCVRVRFCVVCVYACVVCVCVCVYMIYVCVCVVCVWCGVCECACVRACVRACHTLSLTNINVISDRVTRDTQSPIPGTRLVY